MRSVTTASAGALLLLVAAGCARRVPVTNCPPATSTADRVVLFDNRVFPPDLKTDRCEWSTDEPLRQLTHRLLELVPPESPPNLRVSLVHRDEDGTIEPFHRAPDAATTREWPGSLPEYVESLRRCSAPIWARPERTGRKPLSEALGHLDRWHAARGSPDRCAAPERAAADECSQELWILLSGAWSDAFPEDDTLEFLEKLREHPRTRPCTTVISPPGARLHEGVCQMREAGHIRVEEVEAECLEATPPAMGAAEPFGYSCGEAVTPAQCNAEVCQAFWPLVGEDSPRRFKRIDLLGGGQVARGTDRTETGSPLDCGRTDQLVEVKPKSPHHPVHHVLLLDITVSMAPYWDAKDRQRTYDRLLRGISRFMLPQDRLTVYRLGLHLEEVLDHGVGVDPTAYVVSLDRPADNEAGASSILRALKVAASTGGQGILLPRPVDTSRDAPKFRAGVHTVIWVFSDGEESFDKRLDLKAPGRGPTDAWRTASIKRLSEAGEMARLESTLARTPWVGGRLPAVVVLPLSADPGPAAEPKPISPADLIRVFPVAVAFAGTTLEGVFRWYLHQ